VEQNYVTVTLCIPCNAPPKCRKEISHWVQVGWRGAWPRGNGLKRLRRRWWHADGPVRSLFSIQSVATADAVRAVCVSSAQSDDVTVTSRRRRRISGSGRSATSVRSCRGGAAAAAAGAAAPRAGGARATPTPRPARRATADRRAGPARASAGRARCSSRRRPSIVGRRRRRSAPTTTTASLTRATTSSTATTLSAQHRSVHTTARTNTGPTQKHSLPELSMGPFCVTRSNPTHQLTDPTQPTTSGKIWTQPDPTQYN